MEKIEKCTCGKDVSDESTLLDTLYPLNRERTKWNMICQVHNFGCGRTVFAPTKEKALERWNKGLTDEIFEEW